MAVVETDLMITNTTTSMSHNNFHLPDIIAYDMFQASLYGELPPYAYMQRDMEPDVEYLVVDSDSDQLVFKDPASDGD